MVQFSSFSSKRRRKQTMSKKRRRDKMEEPTPVWKIVTEHPDIFNTHVMTKLNGNDVKFFYDVNPESRAAIKRSGARLQYCLEILTHTSTISWALEKCFEKKERFCAQMALNGNFGLLQFLRGELCPWNKETCESAAANGHLECLKKYDTETDVVGTKILVQMLP